MVFSIISVTFTSNIQTMVTINLESGNVLYRFDNGYEIIAQRNRTTVAEFKTRKFVPLNDIAEHIKGHGG